MGKAYVRGKFQQSTKERETWMMSQSFEHDMTSYGHNMASIGHNLHFYIPKKGTTAPLKTSSSRPHLGFSPCKSLAYFEKSHRIPSISSHGAFFSICNLESCQIHFHFLLKILGTFLPNKIFI